jgi:hypothetical protein
MNEKYDVFISYSRKDYVDENNNVIPGNIVSKVKDTLEKMKVKFWFDENGVYSGDEFAPMIARAIKNSEIFLFISSHNSNASDWTSNEIATAHAYKKKIIPFRVDDSVFNESVIIYIAKLDYIDYTKNQEKAIARLKESIESHLKQKADQEKQAIEKKQKEEERLKKAQEKERELSRVRERLSNVTKELDSLRSQWQVSSTLYDELRAKEAALLGKPYQQNVLTLPELKGQDNSSNNESDIAESKKGFFKSIANWFTNPNGKERAPWVSTIVRIIIILGYIGAATLLIFFFHDADRLNDFERPIYINILLFSLTLLIYCYSLYQALKWKRLPIYILLLGLVGTIVWLLFDDIFQPHGDIKVFCMLLPFILATSLLLGIRHHGKTFFEQTEPIRENLHDKQFLTSLALEGVLLITICIPAFLMMRTQNSYYDDSWYEEPVAVEDSTVIAEEAPVDNVVAPTEEAEKVDAAKEAVKDAAGDAVDAAKGKASDAAQAVYDELNK